MILNCLTLNVGRKIKSQKHERAGIARASALKAPDVRHRASDRRQQALLVVFLHLFKLRIDHIVGAGAGLFAAGVATALAFGFLLLGVHFLRQ